MYTRRCPRLRRGPESPLSILLSLSRRDGARMQAGEEIPSEIAPTDRTCRDGTMGPHALPPSRRVRSSLRVNGAGLKYRTARTPPERASSIEPASHRCGPQGLESCLSSLLLGWMIELRRSPRIRCAPPSRRTRLRAVALLPPYGSTKILVFKKKH